MVRASSDGGNGTPEFLSASSIVSREGSSAGSTPRRPRDSRSLGNAAPSVPRRCVARETRCAECGASDAGAFVLLRARERVDFFFARVDVDVRDLETFLFFDKDLPEK